MNRGVAIAQQSLEVSLVRHQIDAQADALRYLAHAYAADYPDDSQATRIWNKAIGENGVPSAQPFSEIIDGTRCKLPSGATSKPFALNIRKLDSIGGDSSPQGPVVSVMNISDFDSGSYSAEEQPTFARVRYDLSEVKSQGLWIEAVRSADSVGDSDRPGFYDFHIRACWQSPGQSVPVTLGTIVRLYEPRG